MTIVVSAAWFLYVKKVVQGAGVLNDGSDESYSYAYYYSDLIPSSADGARSLLNSLLTNPVFALQHALAEEKLLFLGRLFLPLALLPFLAPRARWLLAYGLALTLLASKPAVYSLHFQYTSVLHPFAFALTPLALASLAGRPWIAALGLEVPRLQRALVAAMLGATVVISAKYGVLLENDAFRAGFGRFIGRQLSSDSQATYDWLDGVVQQIPADASVATTKRLAPHVSNRAKVYTFPWGKGADWLLLEENGLEGKDRLWFQKLVETKAYEKHSGHGRGLSAWQRRPEVPLPPRG